MTRIPKITVIVSPKDVAILFLKIVSHVIEAFLMRLFRHYVPRNKNAKSMFKNLN